MLELGLGSSTSADEASVVTGAVRRAEAAIKRHLRYDPMQASRTEFYPGADYDYTGRSVVWETEGDVAILRRRALPATSELQLRHLPVRSITSLFIDYDGRSGTQAGSFPADSERTEGSDFWPNFDRVDSAGASVCTDGIIRSVGQWPTTPGSVKIVSVAGYTEAEFAGEVEILDASQIREAVLVEAVRRAQRAFVRAKQATGFKAGPFQSESLGDYSYSVAVDKNMSYGVGVISAEAVEMLQEFVNWGYQIAS